MKNDISLITPVSRDLLYTKIADTISQYIQKNNLASGDKLPSERELAARFQTSRHSVREALRILENQGIITSQMGSGTYVADAKGRSSIYLEFVKVNYLEMLHIKTELEKYAVRQALGEASPAQLQELEGLLCAMEKNQERGTWDPHGDKQFHYLLADLSGNKMLAQMIKKMIEAFDDYYSVLPQSVQMCLETLPWHRSLLEAIRKHDEPAALQACDEICRINQRFMETAGEAEQ